MLKINGRVFPRAGACALVISLVAAAVKYTDDRNIIQMKSLDTGNESALFIGFTLMMGLILVFRAHQCFTRLRDIALSAHAMRTMMHEAASSLVTFTSRDMAQKQKVNALIHRAMCLFSVAHASAMEAVCDRPFQGFSVLDVDSLLADDIKFLTSVSGHLRVDVVFQWINLAVMDGLYSDLITAPAPIVSRIFQSMEQSKVKFNQMLEVIATPFPFPYSQVVSAMLLVYSVVAPTLVIFWSNHCVTAFVVTFITIMSMWSVQLIATKMEHPFGDAINDLPLLEFQKDLNEALLLLQNPGLRKVPELSPHVDINFENLSMNHPTYTSLSKLSTELAACKDLEACEEESEGESESILDIELPPSHIADSPPSKLHLKPASDVVMPMMAHTAVVQGVSTAPVEAAKPAVWQDLRCVSRLQNSEPERESTDNSPSIIEIWSSVEHQQALCMDILMALKQVIHHLKASRVEPWVIEI